MLKNITVFFSLTFVLFTMCEPTNSKIDIISFEGIWWKSYELDSFKDNGILKQKVSNWQIENCENILRITNDSLYFCNRSEVSSQTTTCLAGLYKITDDTLRPVDVKGNISPTICFYFYNNFLEMKENYPDQIFEDLNESAIDILILSKFEKCECDFLPYGWGEIKIQPYR